MNDYRQRLESSGQRPAFDAACKNLDQSAMQSALEAAGFTPPEIESIVWSNGYLGPEPTEPAVETKVSKSKKIQDEIIYRLGIAVIAGILLGVVFVEVSPHVSRDKLVVTVRHPG